ncbi:MAG: bifunctional metallophosphatase/5'-nucleotidase [Methylococcaceae bacterium]|nr:bifunctional metallophosphatase/5'-nucleotidase [Methylococcaceae bacterium]
MKNPSQQPVEALDNDDPFNTISRRALSRREFLAGAAAFGVTIIWPGFLASAPTGAKTFTILHTNDLHSNFLGLGPAADYSPFTLNDDATRGGYARQAALITQRKQALNAQGPVLVLCAGDYSMGTPFGAATRETGGELQLMSRMGYDATTLGNHEFDLGPEGLGKSISVAVKAGHMPALLASNTDFTAKDPTLAGLQRLAKKGVIRRYRVIERGGLRFGLFGLLGKEAVSVAVGAGAVKFADPVETAKEMVKLLREKEKVDVVIALSHGGMVKDKDGLYTDGEDVHLARDVPGIDVVISGHSHTALKEAMIVNDHTPVVQAGKNGEYLGELVIAMDGGKPKVVSYNLLPIDDTIVGDRVIAQEIEKLKKKVNKAVFASRGYSIDQPLAIAPQDLPNTFTDITASTLLANLCTDAFRAATKADIGFSINGLMRASLTRGKSGVQTVYDVFAVAPLGAGVVDSTAGSALVTGYFTGQDLKTLLEYWLVDNPTHPGEWYPRASGMRFNYDLSRPQYDAVTAIELGDLDRGYQPIDISGKDVRLYSLTCPLMLAPIIMAISKLTKGKLTLVPKNKEGQPLKSRVEALELPASTPEILPPPGITDKASLATMTGKGAVREIKEWQAIMDHLRGLPVKTKGELPVIPVDERAAEVRAIKAG